jgi:hypothetical protein
MEEKKPGLTLWPGEEEQRAKCTKCGLRMISTEVSGARRLKCLRCGHVTLRAFPQAPLLQQVAQVLRRARKLPVGLARNDLRQLAQGLLRLHRAGVQANVEVIERLSD